MTNCRIQKNLGLGLRVSTIDSHIGVPFASGVESNSQQRGAPRVAVRVSVRVTTKLSRPLNSHYRDRNNSRLRSTEMASSWEAAKDTSRVQANCRQVLAYCCGAYSCSCFDELNGDC